VGEVVVVVVALEVLNPFPLFFVPPLRWYAGDETSLSTQSLGGPTHERTERRAR